MAGCWRVGELKRDDGVFIYSGCEKAERGIGVMVISKKDMCIKGYQALSGRVMMIKMSGKPFHMNIV